MSTPEDKKLTHLNSNSKRANIYMVAKEAGVSIATISRVLNDGPYVSAVAKQKVWAAVKKLDYKPSQTAQGLAKKRSNLIGLVIPYCEKGEGSSAVHELICGAADAAMEAGRSIVVVTPGTAYREKKHLDMRRITNPNLDGVIFVGLDLTTSEKKALKEPAVPFVCLKKSDLGYETGLRAARTMTVSLSEDDEEK